MTDKSAETGEKLRTPCVSANGWREYVVQNMKLSAKKLLPGAIIRGVQAYRFLEASERSMYLKIRLENGLGLTKPKLPRIPTTTRSIVFVCFGNIIRSPAAEAMMKRALVGHPDLRLSITSAGLNATPGRAAHPWALATAREFGISLVHHRARLLTSDLVARADVIFAMDYRNQVQIRSRWKDFENKVYMLSAYAGEAFRSGEIRDPYDFGLEETRRCYEVLNTCVRNLLSSLTPVASACLE